MKKSVYIKIHRHVYFELFWLVNCWICAYFSPDSDETTFSIIEDSHLAEKYYNISMDLSLTNTQLFTSQDFYWRTEVLVDYCDVWTLILTAPIHCWGSTDEQVMQCYNSPNLLLKSATSSITWLWVHELSSNLHFCVNYSFNSSLCEGLLQIMDNLFFLNPCILPEEHWTSSSVYVKKHKSKSTWAVYVYFIGILILKYLKCIQFIFGVNVLILL